MADISNEISAFQNAVYGEEVRGSMISLAEKLNDEVEDATGTVATIEAGYDAAMEAAASATDAATNAASSATSAASSATSAAASANSAASNATSKANAAQALSDSINAAETARASAETSRRSAETSRANAEAARVTAETARAGSEANRQSAELTRQESETARNSAELSRVNAEATRSANETQRQSNESTRQGAESNRNTIFTQMQNAFADMQQQTLPPATTSTLGGIIVGEGLSVAADGTLSFEAGDFLTEDEAEATYATITSVEGKADAVHYHAASDITSGTLGVARGGTGVTTAAAERERLGLGSTTDALPVANGGTGATTASGALAAILGGNPLSVANGGTGVETAAEERDRLGLGATTGPVPIASGGTGSTTAADALTALGAASASDLGGYLPLTGGTMTGDLEIEKSAPSFIAKNTDVNQGGSAPSANIAASVLDVLDANGARIGFIPSTHYSNGNIGMGIAARRVVNNVEAINIMRADVKPDGSKSYAVSDAAAFRDAIGASSGIWPIAQGGSGQSGALSGTDLGSIITVNSTNATLSSGYVAYWGKLAMVQLTWKNKNALSVPADGNLTDITVGTLASAYRPKGPIHGLSNGDEAGNATYYINGTAGVISLTAVEGTGAARTIPANSSFSAFFCFVMQ